jgi:hypothetical protein
VASTEYKYVCCKSKPVKFYARSVPWNRRGGRLPIRLVTFHAFCEGHLPKGGHSLDGAQNWKEVDRETWLKQGVEVGGVR